MDIQNIIAICSVVIAVLSLTVTLWQARRNRKNNQLQVFESAFRQVRDSESRFISEFQAPFAYRQAYELIKSLVKEINMVEPKAPQAIEDARATTGYPFMNTLEYLSFLVNHDFITDEGLKGFFSPALIFWYEQVFTRHFPELAGKPSELMELKTAYKIATTHSRL